MTSVREGYELLGVDTYYQQHANDYCNPHFNTIEIMLKDYILSHDIGEKILDFCCGSGEVTKILNECGTYHIEGNDPYTFSLYSKNTGNPCHKYSFKDVVIGKMVNMHYDTIICSFAMHLCDMSMLDTLLYQLSSCTDNLIIVSPHKRPEINAWFELENSFERNRVKMKVYRKIIN